MTGIKHVATFLAGVLVASGMVIAAAHADSVSTGAAASSSLKDKDCADFANQRDAQNYFLNHGGPGADPDNLDADGDGIACESNPCPCYYGTQPPPQPSPSPTPTPQPQPPPTRVKAIIVKVLDGEKVKVRLMPGRVKVGVQVLGVDAPRVTQCGGLESRDSLERTLPEGIAVWLKRDPSQANVAGNGRLLRYVNKASSGKDAGRVQIVRAWAVPEHYARRFQREDDYRKKAKLARQDQRGLWSLC